VVVVLVVVVVVVAVAAAVVVVAVAAAVIFRSVTLVSHESWVKSINRSCILLIEPAFYS
jgi:hypothetical protein